jgi:hypothetical protein
MSSGGLVDKMVVLHGPPGVGKTTLASQWGGGGGFFFNCAGELGEFELYQQSITDWLMFREYSWSIAEAIKAGTIINPCAVIDTADALGRYCSEFVRRELGIAHESDAEWGKGYQALRDAFAINIAKLAALPNFGIVFVAHSDEKKVKTRSSEYDKWVIRGVKSIRETMVDMADLVLMIDFDADDDDKRVIKTKPSRHWEAKERGPSPRLPEIIEWPAGENGWEIIKAWWDSDGS